MPGARRSGRRAARWSSAGWGGRAQIGIRCESARKGGCTCSCRCWDLGGVLPARLGSAESDRPRLPDGGRGATGRLLFSSSAAAASLLVRPLLPRRPLFTFRYGAERDGHEIWIPVTFLLSSIHVLFDFIKACKAKVFVEINNHNTEYWTRSWRRWSLMTLVFPWKILEYCIVLTMIMANWYFVHMCSFNLINTKLVHSYRTSKFYGSL